MAQICDFKIILPAFAEAFTRAEKLSRNDYLMTVALLASISNHASSVIYMIEKVFTALNYDNYTIKTLDNMRHSRRDGHWVGGDRIHTIFIGKQAIAKFRLCGNPEGEKRHYKVTTFDITELTILDMLELSDTERQTHTSRKRKRQRHDSLRLPTAQGRPKIDVVAVRLGDKPSLTFRIKMVIEKLFNPGMSVNLNHPNVDCA